MKFPAKRTTTSMCCLYLLPSMVSVAQNKDNEMASTSRLYSYTVKTIDGKERSLSDYQGKVLLIVNVASECGFTPQYRGLQEIYEKYKDRGFVILGFPSNDFGKQEPGTDMEIKDFCERNYTVTFDMFSKIDVKGSNQAPLYTYRQRIPNRRTTSSGTLTSSLLTGKEKW